MKKTAIILSGIILTISLALLFSYRAENQPTFQGLVTVPCLDPTKKIVEKFSLHISISINGEKVPLEKKIGHDYGNCLRAIHTDDNSGKVYISSNEKETFTLGQFFDVWHKTFSEDQIFEYTTDKNHQIQVFVDNNKVNTYRDTQLLPDKNIKVVYN